VLKCEADRIAEVGVVLMRGRQVQVVGAGVGDRIHDLLVERQKQPRRQVRFSGHELQQIAQCLVSCKAQKVSGNKVVDAMHVMV